MQISESDAIGCHSEFETFWWASAQARTQNMLVKFLYREYSLYCIGESLILYDCGTATQFRPIWVRREIYPWKSQVETDTTKTPQKIFHRYFLWCLSLKCVKSKSKNGYNDVGDLKLVTICGCWRLNFDVDDNFWILVPDTFCLQHILSPTFVTNIDATAKTIFWQLQIWDFYNSVTWQISPSRKNGSNWVVKILRPLWYYR